MSKIYFLFILFIMSIPFANANIIEGSVVDESGEPLVAATITIKELDISLATNENGEFIFKRLPSRELTLVTSFIGYENDIKKIDLTQQKSVQILIKLRENNSLNTVEVFGERYKQPEKLDAITRMPLRPSEQIQSISVISDKVITEQGALTITDAVRNVPGVTLFGSYGGLRESMSTRGYRGVPVLKNGVRVDSDFRTGSLASDMQGVESIQVIKGSAAITQGVGNDLGSPGGVINVVTKTPKFKNAGEVSVRTGSWGQFRPTFDIQSVLDKNNTIAFRLNGAYERSDGFRKHVSSNSVYINPSIEWRPDDKTTITAELDYLNADKTPDRGTYNLKDDTEEALYEMPFDKFLGFKNDNSNTKTMTYALRMTRQIADKLSIRAAYFNSSNTTDQIGASLSKIKGETNNALRQRSIARTGKEDLNSTFQLDLVGRDVFTGTVKHTFQVGFDYKRNNLTQTSYSDLYGLTPEDSKTKHPISYIDIVDITQPIDNGYPAKYATIAFANSSDTRSKSSSYGIMLQEVMTINKYAKAILGLRYSYGTSSDETSANQTTGDAWNPMAGIMITPIENINLFGSYTTTTSLRSAANKKEDGSEIGASMSKQWEFGIKSDWLDNRLRFNFTYFMIKNANLSHKAYDEAGVEQTYYEVAGDLLRDGVEVELSGRILPNLQVMMGYAYLNARYEDSPAYQNGSAPMNAPEHTANGWLYYTLNESPLKGLSIGIGSYYVGKRPVNDFSLKPDGHGSMTGKKPFDMPAYTTVNAQLAYSFKNVTARVFFNNIFDEIGYSSYYRGGYINQIDPRNFAAVLSYQF